MTARRLITVDGLDGSGKSMLARRLVDALGSRALLLGVDEVRRPVAWTAPDQELDLYYHARYDLAALGGALDAYFAGADALTLPVFDGATESMAGESTRSLRGVDQLVLEGVFVARLPHPALTIWVHVDEAEARRRILARDLGKGRTPEEVVRRIETRYLPAHRRYLAEHDPRERATVVIDNTDPAAPILVRNRADADHAVAQSALRALVG